MSETGTHEPRNSRNVRTAPHDSSMKNSTQLSSRPTLIISVNFKQPRGEEEKGEEGRRRPRRENHRPRPNRLLGRDLVGFHVLRIIWGPVRALSRHVAKKIRRDINAEKLEKKAKEIGVDPIEFHSREKELLTLGNVLLRLFNIEIY